MSSGESIGSGLRAAVDAFRDGRPVLIHDADDRENETDVVVPAAAVTPETVARLRNDAGGLICVALAHDVAESFDLPFLQEEIDHPASESHDLAYDERSSFSLPVNHRDVRTGVTDRDRARTITALADAAAHPGETEFAEEFRAPGHVPVLKAAPGLLDDRQGHTELGMALAERGGLAPAVVVCEMVDGATGNARSRASALAYADRHGLVFLDGRDLLGD